MEINSGDKTKVIAFYLPQYHAIPENDAAWGEGFTEWTNVKKAEKAFNWHYQPKEPLNDNYYSLLDENTQIWQSELAQKYGVFGFCYYHYWFKNGKKLLEKPAENMLENKKITMPFCFCWANENWSKNWDGGNKEVIVEQDYGDESEWEEHFLYLLPFFKDERYITYDNKPVFIIYKPELIPEVEKMAEYFRKRAVEEGFDGLEIMVQFPEYKNVQKEDKFYDRYICFEPAYTSYFSLPTRKLVIRRVFGKIKRKLQSILYKNNKFGCILVNYDDCWRTILKRDNENGNLVRGAFTGWDNTARKRSGFLYVGSNPKKFKKYFKKLVDKVRCENGMNAVFINAWNEWGEGAYLEPDKKHGYGYLEGIANAVNKKTPD